MIYVFISKLVLSGSMGVWCTNACFKLKKSTSFYRKMTFYTFFSKSPCRVRKKKPGENATLETILFWSKIRWFSKIIFLSLGLSWSIYIKVYVLLFNHILNKIKCFKNEFYYKIWSFAFPLVVFMIFLPQRFSAFFIVWDLFSMFGKWCPKRNTHWYIHLQTHINYIDKTNLWLHFNNPNMSIMKI